MFSHTALLPALAVGLLLTGATAQGGPPHGDPGYPTGPPEPECREVWKYIGKELKHWFIDDYGECTQLAAQAVRLPFHDCFPDGGCDGSIILTDECTTRIENEQMIPICGVLYKIFNDHGVGAADLINFAACESAMSFLPHTRQH